MPAQLALIEPPVTRESFARSGLESISWSHSRRSVLEQCPRRYYYQYFGSSNRLAIAEPDKAQLRELKLLSSRHERAGSLLHTAIAVHLRDLQMGRASAPGRVIAECSALFERDRAFSLADAGPAVASGGQFAPVRLREFVYHQPGADELWAESQQRLTNALRTFFASASIKPFRLAGGSRGALVESPFSIRPGLKMCRVGGKVDLAYKQAETVVVDWKLGSADGRGDDSLQLAVYAMWAKHQFRVVGETPRVFKAYLQQGEIVEFEANDGMLRAARARIAQDAQRMVELQGYGERGVAEAFTPTGTAAVCQNCVFQRVCPEGRRLLNA